MHTFEALRMEYKALWQRMEISQRAANKVDVVARKLLLSKHRYHAVAAKTGVPWFLIAVLHERESSADFTAHLHNGDPLELRTYHVPAGRPVNGAPPFTWEESAIDALEMKNLHRIGAWPIERIAYDANATTAGVTGSIRHRPPISGHSATFIRAASMWLMACGQQPRSIASAEPCRC